LTEKPRDTHPEDSGGISVVVTVRDEREELDQLMQALETQTRAPDEVVVVDGGSVEATKVLLDRWRERGLPLRLLEAEGTNISEGRNIGIAAAANEWIACTDAGCRPLPEWLAEIDRVRHQTEFVGGVWIARGETPLEEAVAVALHPDPGQLPASSGWVTLSQRLFGRRYALTRTTGRSMAFTKRVWRLAGGFPEHLYAGEDVAFSRAVARRAKEGLLVPGAAVVWRPHRSLAQTMRVYARYARGDVRGGHLLRHAVRAAALFVVPRLLRRGNRRVQLGVLLAGAAYTALPLRRAHAAGVPTREYLWLVPSVILIRDLATSVGAARGLLDSLGGRPQPSPTTKRD
jgi:glycosyltransferase involved in cell wall biosynthesis